MAEDPISMSQSPLTALEATSQLRDGIISAEELVTVCLDRIAAVEPELQAWAHLDPDHALQQARLRDQARSAGMPMGPLHGVPVGVKDIFDTKDFPTENGTPLDRGRRPKQDSRVVALLREAGAVIMGKTVTTELAVYAPGKTRNPHNLEHTPGGSSSGSAAAVAAGMVPLAIGSQTNGSVVRPASFCGVCGYKASHGAISRQGVLSLSPPLDTMGVFAQSVEDLALIGDVLQVYDERDGDMQPRARPRLSEIAAEAPPVTPSFAFVKTPVWDKASDDCQAAFAELTEVLGDKCDTIELPAPFAEAIELHRKIMTADLARSFTKYYQRGRDELSEQLRAMIEEGQGVLAIDYNRARDWIGVLNAGLDEIFERYDAILTPAAAGEAPKGLDKTGDPAFNTLWTLCGTPAVSLPLLTGSQDLPIGVQLVGPLGDDARLLRNARWLVQRTLALADDVELEDEAPALAMDAGA